MKGKQTNELIYFDSQWSWSASSPSLMQLLSAECGLDLLPTFHKKSIRTDGMSFLKQGSDSSFHSEQLLVVPPPPSPLCPPSISLHQPPPYNAFSESMEQPVQWDGRAEPPCHNASNPEIPAVLPSSLTEKSWWTLNQWMCLDT